MMATSYPEYEEKMKKTVTVLESEFAAVRAGRANPAILNKVTVDYYGTQTPISQMAAISVYEARTLVVQPWDISTIKNIEKAIMISDVGINPQNDGKVIRLTFPQLTEERRHEIVRNIHKFEEDAKIAVRAIRREAIEVFKEMKKKSKLTEDDLKDAEDDIQELTEKYVKLIETATSQKEKETMSI